MTNRKSSGKGPYILGALGALIGVALITVGVMLPKVVSNEKAVPLDLAATTITLHDPAAEIGPNYRGPDGKKELTAPVNRQFKITLEEPATEEEASARVGVTTARTDVEDDLESLLEAQVWSFTVDRRSGEAKGGAKVSDTPATPATDGEIAGYWAKFPQGTEQRSYDYFDMTLRRALPAEFTGTRNVTTADGHEHELYVFRQEIPATSVAKEYAGIRNTITVEGEDGKPQRAQLYHEGWRELTVEPASGLLVSVEEKVKDTYRDSSGKDVQNLLKFHGKTPQSVTQSMLDQAMEVSGQRNTDKWGVALIVAGVIVAAASVVLVLWLRVKRRAGLKAEREGDREAVGEIPEEA
ncbi:DUF3068 domain-containing protein [uncultured Corynebacterium sp.]|mgnify:FL=1|uniref:DUF3068 domain-containing protein n=1 Tax=uncultured Corynebacterium sp. TaxID=159447 RepID=UPI0025DBC7A6|nr:DUF3068 domain-containing protein [uncultured Corynebacterium sp.]